MITTLVCPHCGYENQVEGEDAYHIISYWGDDIHEWWCDECDKTFEVKEWVSRHWEVVKG